MDPNTPRHSGAHADGRLMAHTDGHSLSVPHTAALATGPKRVGFKFSFVKSPKASRTYEVQPVAEPHKSSIHDSEKSPLAPDSPSSDDHFEDGMNGETKRPSFHIAPRKKGTSSKCSQHDGDFFDTSEPPSPTATSSTEGAGHSTEPSVFTFSPKDWADEMEKHELISHEEKPDKNGDPFANDPVPQPPGSVPTFIIGSAPPTVPTDLATLEHKNHTQPNGTAVPQDGSAKNIDPKFANLDKRKVRKMHSAVKLNRVSLASMLAFYAKPAQMRAHFMTCAFFRLSKRGRPKVS